MNKELAGSSYSAKQRLQLGLDFPDPPQLQAQLIEKSELIKEISDLFQNHVPELLQTWLFFNLFVIQMPEHRDMLVADGLLCILEPQYRHLQKYWPKFADPTVTTERARTMPLFYEHLRFFCDICLKESLAFTLFDASTERLGIFPKRENIGDEMTISQEMKSVAFRVDEGLVDVLMKGNSNYQRAISILQTDKGYFIVAGPVVFAKHACSATFEPRLAPSSHKYSTINFHSEAATNVFRYKMKDVMFMLVYPIKGKPTKQTTEMREFVVKYPLRLMPWPTCSCNICQGKIDIIKGAYIACYILEFIFIYFRRRYSCRSTSEDFEGCHCAIFGREEEKLQGRIQPSLQREGGWREKRTEEEKVGIRINSRVDASPMVFVKRDSQTCCLHNLSDLSLWPLRACLQCFTIFSNSSRQPCHCSIPYGV